MIYTSAMDYEQLIRNVPDFPISGILFRDITPLLADPKAYHAAVRAIADQFRDANVDHVVAIESRGYLLGAPIALELGVGFVPVRKQGKLPLATHQAQYELEYGSATIEIHKDSLANHHQVLIIDDVLATGGTMAATIELVKQCGAKVVGIAVLIELSDLNGRENLDGHKFFSLISY